MTEPKQDKPTIEYPAPWGYKVIGTDETALRAAVQECLDSSLVRDSGDRDFELGFSRESKGGKYLSLSLNLTVVSEAERDDIFQALRDHPRVLMVM